MSGIHKLYFHLGKRPKVAVTRLPPPQTTWDKLLWAAGSLCRGVGQTLDELGRAVHGPSGLKEELVPNSAYTPYPLKPTDKDKFVIRGDVEELPERLKRLTPFEKVMVPLKAPDAFIALNASVIGNVKLGKGSSIWYNATVRGDVNGVEIGEGSNVQDNAVIHVSQHTKDGSARPTIIGKNTTIASGATVHACEIGDDCMVGMGATVLDGVKVESGAMVAAGAVVSPGATVPTGEIWAGVPAKKLRALEAEELAFIKQSAAETQELAAEHKFENSKGMEEVELENWITHKRDYLNATGTDERYSTVRDPQSLLILSTRFSRW